MKINITLVLWWGLGKWYGEQDQAVRLRGYKGGYPALTKVMNKLKENQEFWNSIRQEATGFSRESAAGGVDFLE